MVENINAIIIHFENGEKITVDKKLISNFFIGNIDKNCEEIPYKKSFNLNILEANLFTLKIDKAINNLYDFDVLNRILAKKDIIGISLLFNNEYMYFSLASDAEPFLHEYNNSYEESFVTANHLCLLISEFRLKFKPYLFI